MTPEMNTNVVDVAKDSIEKLTKALVREIEPLHIQSTPETKETIFENCEAILARLNFRINQLRRFLK